MKHLSVLLILLSTVTAQVDYNSQIQPVFNQDCTGCHPGNGGLDLTSYSALMNGGNSGAVVKVGDAANSLLVQRIEGTITPRMPKGADALSDSTISLIKQWINEGAAEAVSVTAEIQLPARFEIVGNYPNPFNPSTRIVIDAAESWSGRAAIMSTSGRTVYDFGQIDLRGGSNSLIWQGVDNRGRALPAGVYLFVLQQEELLLTHRLVLLK